MRLALLALPLLLGACATAPSGGTRIVDNGRGLEAFDRVGEANWALVDGALQATAGGKDPAYLVTRQSYGDVMIRAEFWASDDANSGIFFRCQDPKKIGDESCYEANIFDQRPDPSYATGAIVKVAKSPVPAVKAGGRWSTMEITARGPRLVVVFNGQTTVDVTDPKLARGPIALQWGRGTIKWRNVEVKPL